MDRVLNLSIIFILFFFSTGLLQAAYPQDYAFNRYNYQDPYYDNSNSQTLPPIFYPDLNQYSSNPSNDDPYQYYRDHNGLVHNRIGEESQQWYDNNVNDSYDMGGWNYDIK